MRVKVEQSNGCIILRHWQDLIKCKSQVNESIARAVTEISVHVVETEASLGIRRKEIRLGCKRLDRNPARDTFPLCYSS